VSLVSIVIIPGFLLNHWYQSRKSSKYNSRACECVHADERARG